MALHDVTSLSASHRPAEPCLAAVDVGCIDDSPSMHAPQEKQGKVLTAGKDGVVVMSSLQGSGLSFLKSFAAHTVGDPSLSLESCITPLKLYHAFETVTSL